MSIEYKTIAEVLGLDPERGEDNQGDTLLGVAISGKALLDSWLVRF